MEGSEWRAALENTARENGTTVHYISQETLLTYNNGIDVYKRQIYISSPYIYDLSSVTPQITFDADEISPSADTAQNFSNLDNPVKYTLSSAADEDVTYTVHIERVGDDPYLDVYKRQRIYKAIRFRL